MWDNLLHFLPMSLLFVMMPGPDLAFILKTSFGQGRPTAQGVAFLPQDINPTRNATRQLSVPRLGIAGIAFGWLFCRRRSWRICGAILNGRSSASA